VLATVQSALARSDSSALLPELATLLA